MRTPNRRPARVAEMIRTEISEILLYSMRDPRIGLVTVTDVKISPDLKHARVYVSILGSAEEKKTSLAVLNNAAPHLRHELGARARLRVVPDLSFFYDQSIEYGAHIEELIQQIKHEPEPESDSDAESESHSEPE